jgi:hypothetical protein
LLLAKPVAAHQITTEPWLLVNGEKTRNYNDIPKTIGLPWGEHEIEESFSPEEKIDMAININSFEEDLGIANEELFTTWQVIDGDFYEGNKVELSFPQTGNYILEVEIIDLSRDQSIFADTVMLTVGEIPAAPLIEVEGVLVEPDTSTENRFFDTDRQEEMKFKVVDADLEKYIYVWEMGNGEIVEGIEARRVFQSDKLPTYVVLRKTDRQTNTFSENYVRIDSDVEPANKVQTPPDLMGGSIEPSSESSAEGTTDRNGSTKTLEILLITIPLLTASLVGLFLFIYLRRRRET